MPKSWSAKREHEHEPEPQVAQQGERQRGQSDAENLSLGWDAFGVQANERGRTYEELYREAQEKGIKGRSSMSKAELERRLSH
jgi:hypothetical protein